MKPSVMVPTVTGNPAAVSGGGGGGEVANPATLPLYYDWRASTLGDWSRTPAGAPVTFTDSSSLNGRNPWQAKCATMAYYNPGSGGQPTYFIYDKWNSDGVQLPRTSKIRLSMELSHYSGAMDWAMALCNRSTLLTDDFIQFYRRCWASQADSWYVKEKVGGEETNTQTGNGGNDRQYVEVYDRWNLEIDFDTGGIVWNSVGFSPYGVPAQQTHTLVKDFSGVEFDSVMIGTYTYGDVDLVAFWCGTGDDSFPDNDWDGFQ